MPFDARIVFTGVCLYAPDKDWRDINNVLSDLLVIMPDGRRDLAARVLGMTISSHYPYLLIPVEDLQFPNDVAYQVDNLEGLQVSFRVDAASAGHNSFKATRHPSFDPSNPPTSSNGADVRWILDLEDCFQNKATLLPSAKQPNPPDVSCRVAVTSGTVSTHFNHSMEWPGQAWAFAKKKPTGTVVSRPYANQLEVYFQQVEELWLDFTRLDGGTPPPSRLLKPVGSFKQLEIVLGNLCSVTSPTEILRGKEGDSFWRRAFPTGINWVNDGIAGATSDKDDDLPLAFTLLQEVSQHVAAYGIGRLPTLFTNLGGGAGTRTAKCFGGKVKR